MKKAPAERVRALHQGQLHAWGQWRLSGLIRDAPVTCMLLQPSLTIRAGAVAPLGGSG